MPETHSYSNGSTYRQMPGLPLLFVFVFGIITLAGCRTTDTSSLLPQLSTDEIAALPTDTLQLLPVAHSFSRITDVFVATSGVKYVADAGRHHIIRLSASGERVDSLGGRGVGPVQFDLPEFLDAGNELKIFVSDVGNHRVAMFDRRWQPLGFLDLRPYRYEPGALVQTPQGELIFWDQDGRRLRKVRSDAQPDHFYNPDVSQVEHDPVTLLWLQNGTLLLADGHSGVFHRFSADGRRQGFLHVGIAFQDAVLHQGEIIVLTSYGLLRLRTTGEILHLYRFDESEVFTRMAVHENRVYLARRSALYKSVLQP